MLYVVCTYTCVLCANALRVGAFITGLRYKIELFSHTQLIIHMRVRDGMLVFVCVRAYHNVRSYTHASIQLRVVAVVVCADVAFV